MVLTYPKKLDQNPKTVTTEQANFAALADWGTSHDVLRPIVLKSRIIPSAPELAVWMCTCDVRSMVRRYPCKSNVQRNPMLYFCLCLTRSNSLGGGGRKQQLKKKPKHCWPSSTITFLSQTYSQDSLNSMEQERSDFRWNSWNQSSLNLEVYKITICEKSERKANTQLYE